MDIDISGGPNARRLIMLLWQPRDDDNDDDIIINALLTPAPGRTTHREDLPKRESTPAATLVHFFPVHRIHGMSYSFKQAPVATDGTPRQLSPRLYPW